MLSLLDKTKFTIEIPNILHTIPILMQQVPKWHIDINYRQFEHPFREFDWAKARQTMMAVWGNQKRKVMISLGVLGSGYFVYKIYEGYRRKVISNKEIVPFDDDKAVDEAIRSQLETLFDNIQRISDTITLPYAMHSLRDRVSEKLDLTYFMEKLMQTKGESSFLATRERFELWEKVKVLSFTRAATSLWTMTMLTLYARIQVNILGRHLYFEMTRSDGSQLLGEESDALSKIEKQEYLATADFLSTYGLNSLIMNMRNAVSQVMKTKQLNSQFSMETVQETMMEILDLFMGIGSDLVLINWVDYILPETASQYRELMSAANADDSSTLLMDFTKLEQLISETREVLSSSDFSTVVEISLRKGVDLLVEEMKVAHGSEAIPLAKLLPHVAQLSTPLLEEPTSNKFIQLLKNAPEVQLFYTFLYADIPRV
ncbi:peroxisome biogenesis protein 3-1-like isoform X2 [Carex rostrata]